MIDVAVCAFTDAASLQRLAGSQRGRRVFRLFLLLIGVFLGACTPAAVSHNNSGNGAFDRGAYEAAIQSYRMAQISAPERPEPYYNAANAYNRRGLLESVVILSRQALATADAELAARTWYNLGNGFFDQQAWSQAVHAYREALLRVPDDPDAKYNLELATERWAEQESAQGAEGGSGQDDGSGAGETDGSEAVPPADAGAETEQPPPDDAGREREALTPEQARQLLVSAVGAGQTLPERLTEGDGTMGLPPVNDW